MGRPALYLTTPDGKLIEQETRILYSDNMYFFYVVKECSDYYYNCYYNRSVKAALDYCRKQNSGKFISFMKQTYRLVHTIDCNIPTVSDEIGSGDLLDSYYVVRVKYDSDSTILRGIDSDKMKEEVSKIYRKRRMPIRVFRCSRYMFYARDIRTKKVYE